jgi:hypothetical protein
MTVAKKPSGRGNLSALTAFSAAAASAAGDFDDRRAIYFSG